MPGKTYVQTTINGEQVDFLCEPRQSLLECLRDVIGLTGTKPEDINTEILKETLLGIKETKEIIISNKYKILYIDLYILDYFFH